MTKFILTPKRREFLLAAAQPNARITKTRPGVSAPTFTVGGVVLREGSGRMMERQGLIEPVKRPGTQSFEPSHKSPSGYTLGWLYRLTKKGEETASSLKKAADEH